MIKYLALYTFIRIKDRDSGHIIICSIDNAVSLEDAETDGAMSDLYNIFTCINHSYSSII